MADTVQLRLGTRRSPLAMAQAQEARSRLCAAHGWSEDAVELVPVLASGDRIQDRPLAEIGGKALWTRELDQWLAAGEIDAAVHSMKDVETIRPPELAIAAVLPRADKRDVLLGAATVAAPSSTSRLSARGRTAAMTSSGGRIVSTSFSECTAASISPAASRWSSSRVHSALPPISASGRS